jgi:hypothetical protein
MPRSGASLGFEEALHHASCPQEVMLALRQVMFCGVAAK